MGQVPPHGAALDPEFGPLNRQKLKHEKWTRVVRVGEEYAGTARLHTILTDMIAFAKNPPISAEMRSKQEDRSQTSDQEPGGPISISNEMRSKEMHSRKAWGLLFDPEACDMEHVGKTLEEMELPEDQIVDSARKITGLREHLRLTAATVASQPDQLKFYEEKELKNLAAQVSRYHYPLMGSQKRSRLKALR